MDAVNGLEGKVGVGGKKGKHFSISRVSQSDVQIYHLYTLGNKEILQNPGEVGQV